MSSNTKRKTYKQLEREIIELKAQMSHSYFFANVNIDKTNISRNMGSGVMLQLTALGGKELINPVLIRDGLSDETIAAIKSDLKRSQELGDEFTIKEQVR